MTKPLRLVLALILLALGLLAIGLMLFPTVETPAGLESKGGDVVVATMGLLERLVSLGTAMVTLVAAVITFRSARVSKDT
jgi:uncharacterized membrane protein YphA (DoxX/SURF4 family)